MDLFEGKQLIKGGGGGRSTMDSALASHPAAPGSIFGVPEVYMLLISPRFIDSSALLSIKWTIQKLNTVEQTIYYYLIALQKN